MISGIIESLEGHGSCGLNILYSYCDRTKGEIQQQNNYGNRCHTPKTLKLGDEGTGYCIAAFNEYPESRAMYEEICKTKKVVYQSETRNNPRSDNNFFFIVFEDK